MARLQTDLMHCWIGALTFDPDGTLQLVLKQRNQVAELQLDFDRPAVVISAGRR